jgi:hypothetical protein
MSLTPGFPAHGCFKAAYGIVARYLTYPALRAQYQNGKLLCELFVTLKDAFW